MAAVWPYLLMDQNHFQADTSRHWDELICKVSTKFLQWFLSRRNNGDQRTSGPVNAHLTPGPGIYLNAFIHVYSPRAGVDNPLGTNVDVNRKPLSLCPFVANFKTISLKSDFIQVFSCFPHVYSPRQVQTTPWSQNFYFNINLLSLWSFAVSLFH